MVARSHGWFNLPPFDWDEERGELSLSFLAAGIPVSAKVRQRDGVLRAEVAGARRLGEAAAREARQTVASCLRLDEDLASFHQLAREHPRLSWVCERGAGRVLRAPTAFEDLIKLVCTTNCSWSLTRAMVTRLVDALGADAPGGKTFPTAEAMARRRAPFFRERVRAGYRAPYLQELARLVRRGEVDLEAWRSAELSTDELRRSLLALPGVGPYAAAHMLRLCGHYGDPGIDSWCRAKYRRIYQPSRAPSDRGIARKYRRFGRFLGLALWMDLTREWHVGPPEEAWP